MHRRSRHSTALYLTSPYRTLPVLACNNHTGLFSKILKSQRTWRFRRRDSTHRDFLLCVAVGVVVCTTFEGIFKTCTIRVNVNTLCLTSKILLHLLLTPRPEPLRLTLRHQVLPQPCNPSKRNNYSHVSTRTTPTLPLPYKKTPKKRTTHPTHFLLNR